MSMVRGLLVGAGFLIIVASVVVFAINPTALDQYFTEGQNLRFSIMLNRGLMADPNVESVSLVPLSFSSATLDTKVEVEIQGYRTFESTQWQSGFEGGTGTVFAYSFVPVGVYDITFRSFNRGGELCDPLRGCSWVLDDELSGVLTVGTVSEGVVV